MNTLPVAATVILPITEKDTTSSRKKVCLAMYYGEIPLGRNSLYTLLTSIYIAENNTSAGQYANKMRERLRDHPTTFASDEGCLKSILAVLITLL